MLKTTALPQVAAGQPGLTTHEVAVRHSLVWADKAAADHDYAGALAWLDVIEAIGCPLPEEQLRKRGVGGWPSGASEMRPTEATPPAATDALTLADVFPPTTLVGRCRDCAQLVLAHHPHEWADRATRELCWPHDHGAVLYCGTCSDEHERASGTQSDG